MTLSKHDTKTSTSLYLSLDKARELAASVVTRYMDAQDLLDGAKDAQAPEYYRAVERYEDFLDGAMFTFLDRSRERVQGDLFHALAHEGATRPQRGDGRVEWMGRMIDHLTSRWGVTNGTH